MKILLVTGRLAEGDVKRLAERYDLDVYVADVDIAAFITPSHLKRLDLSKYDLVLVPGLAKGDWKSLEREKGVKIRLGPIHLSDLPMVLENLDKIELSHEIPACRLLSGVKTEETIRMVESQSDYKFKIGDVEIGGRMKIVAEIVDATELSKDELIEKIEYYHESGADIIDLGIPLEFDVKDVRRVVKIARDRCKALSIDTFDKKAIEVGVELGVDMIMSISYSNLECSELLGDEVAVVAVERDVDRLKRLVELLRKKTEKVVADPILDPPMRVASSIVRYMRYREIDPETPLLFGVGNVTELIDADSIGINAIMACIAEEIGVDLLFTTEASAKTRGSVKELKVASYMAKAAKLKKTPPKDLGLNLLVLKEKTKISAEEPSGKIIEGKKSDEFIRDPKGDFRIWIWRDKIICKHDKATIVGKTAKEIVDTVIALNLVSRLDHAAYLGRELMKAEIALKLKKNYMQDEELNFGTYK